MNDAQSNQPVTSPVVVEPCPLCGMLVAGMMVQEEGEAMFIPRRGHDHAASCPNWRSRFVPSSFDFGAIRPAGRDPSFWRACYRDVQRELVRELGFQGLLQAPRISQIAAALASEAEKRDAEAAAKAERPPAAAEPSPDPTEEEESPP